MASSTAPATSIGTTMGHAPLEKSLSTNSAATCPTQNATIIMPKPDHDTARPARCGRSPTAPACPQGWWMPWPRQYSAWPTSSGTALSGMSQQPSAWMIAPVMLSDAPSRTVRTGP